MRTPENYFLTTLRTLLGDRGEARIYPCIQDLIEHGLALDRFKPGEPTPQRQDLTQYVAAWCRHAGLSEEECRGWLVDYCATKLASISRRTPAAIRHSTKSNIKYIYGSQIPFLCECAANRFRARCCPECPVHADMQAKLAIRAEEARNPSPDPRHAPPVITVVLPVKARYREQLEVAMRLVQEELAKGTKKKRILELLEQRGLKTRTGRKWTHSILLSELAKSEAPPIEPTVDRNAARFPGGLAVEQEPPPQAGPAGAGDEATADSSGGA